MSTEKRFEQIEPERKNFSKQLSTSKNSSQQRWRTTNIAATNLNRITGTKQLQSITLLSNCTTSKIRFEPRNARLDLRRNQCRQTNRPSAREHGWTNCLQ